jgi:hypothetical protein
MNKMYTRGGAAAVTHSLYKNSQQDNTTSLQTSPVHYHVPVHACVA